MEIDELSASATLACAQATVLDRRHTEVRDLELAAHWCDLHAALPRDPAGYAVLTPKGRPLLVEIGGDGTPMVNDLSLCELAIARGVGTTSARNIAADALDLRHRLPRTWAEVKALECEPWVARKVASLSRRLPHAVAWVVDDAVAAAISGEAPSRVLELCQAKIIEADPAAHQARLDEEARRRYVSLGRIDEHGLQLLIARVTAGDAYYVDALITRVADILVLDPASHGLPADPDRGLLRSTAVGWLARPLELVALLLTHPEPEPADEPEVEPEVEVQPEVEPEPEVEPVETPTPTDRTPPPAHRTVSAADLLAAVKALDTRRLRPRATLYVHLSEAALVGVPGTARVEGLGPHSLTQLRDLLAHSDVTVKPVIDLHDRVSVSAYEFPEHLKERVHLLHHGDAFPHAGGTSRRTDIDHPLGWTRDGPPDQTHSHTGQPLSRTPHRAKTHLGYRCTPMPTGEKIWRTPHGQYRIVDARGTHVINQAEYDAWTSDSDLERGLARLLHRHRAGAS